ncbi:MAG: CatA-like O-acetyltransferase [Terrisporobacter sp.]|jgi:chloramphenicol O-acetyltransferase type A|nr:CatA-like O-acetyltransferase [uncultured Terrisporobacter sp.]
MPLSITVHHATIDGYHIKEFLEDINELINTCENWIKI